MINPHKDLVILRGWPHTKYANREYHFTRDSEDQLLHATAAEFALPGVPHIDILGGNL